MKQYLIILVAGFTWLGGASAASAGSPAWCGNAKLDANSSDVRNLSAKDPTQVVEAIVTVLCSGSAEVDAHRGQAESARTAWSKKLGMKDADWADAVTYAADKHHDLGTDLSAKGLAALTPIDQYVAIRNGFRDANSATISDELYATDALGAHLTEVGRLAYVESCLKNDSVARADGDVVKWAICQPDIDALDAAKLADQLRADTAHDGTARMLLRFKALELPDALADYNERKAKVFKKDDVYKKIFEVALKARAEWAQGIGANARLLQLVEDADSGALFHSRKLLEGCEARTAEALAAAVSTIPAKSFAAMHDLRDDPFKGFAAAAGPLLVNTPAVNLAATAFAECTPETATGDFLAAFLQEVPGVRGPRSAALGAVLGETFTFDDTSAKKLEYPAFKARPYRRSGGAINSAGGVVKSVKPDKDALAIDLEKTSVVQEDCVQSHRTHRLSRIRPDGTLEYESICDKTAMVKHDTTWTNFKVSTAHAKQLTRGVVFSAVQHGKLGDVIAIWPSKAAKTPSMVLGATLR
jgi:hypothetical protein